MEAPYFLSSAFSCATLWVYYTTPGDFGAHQDPQIGFEALVFEDNVLERQESNSYYSGKTISR